MGNFWGNLFQKGEIPPPKPQTGKFPHILGNVTGLLVEDHCDLIEEANIDNKVRKSQEKLRLWIQC